PRECPPHKGRSSRDRLVAVGRVLGSAASFVPPLTSLCSCCRLLPGHKKMTSGHWSKGHSENNGIPGGLAGASRRFSGSFVFLLVAITSAIPSPWNSGHPAKLPRLYR